MEDSEKQNVSAAGRNNQGEAKSTQSQTVMSEYNGKVDPIEEIEAADMVNAADEFTEEQYRKVLRKVDWILLPLMWICSGAQYADKVSVSTQATFGLIKDTHLVGQQFSWLTSIFYIAFLVAEAPGNYILQRVSVGPTVAVCMFIWGILVFCVAAAKNFTDLMIIRFLQGAAECTTYPALVYITSTFYTTSEHAHRSLIWSTANAGMDLLTSLINYGIGTHAKQHPTGLAPWKGISLFLGSLTVVLSVVTYFIFGTPSEVRWLSAEEKRIAQARIVKGQTGTDAQKQPWKWDQVITTFKDPQTYFLFFLVLVNNIPNGGTTSFGNLVYVSFGFTPLDTIVKGKIPQQSLSIIVFLTAGYLNLKFPGIRFLILMASVVPAFAGMLALALLPRNGLLWARWGCYLITVIGNVAGPLIWTLVPSNIAGRTKKSATGTVLFIAYCAGNCIGAQVFRAKDAPRYIPAIIICSAMYGLEFVIMFAWRTYYLWQNKRRDRLVAEMGLTPEESKHQGAVNAESDMTDYENVHFRYSY
ncbi:hypothetical protein NQ176_g6746 [Zarea fungicola]|uniref:Uncharacterized protein n=1 Tax=Zarea fungicola TaxID=93591 RepID=A0ACC1N1S3_9HYPO|nr:hypothetical protein NQ176_g6746 [Lecanicillium fungicola]